MQTFQILFTVLPQCSASHHTNALQFQNAAIRSIIQNAAMLPIA